MKRDFWRNVKLLLARLSHLDVNEQQQREIDYLREENQTLRGCLKATGKRIILTDAQRKNLEGNTQNSNGISLRENTCISASE